MASRTDQDALEVAALRNPAMPDGKDFGRDIEVPVVVDESEVMVDGY
ncbi:hypothetical protein [Mycolicibacterium komossense]|nr:hypothetical protein [Mycolicibacterium komossense]